MTHISLRITIHGLVHSSPWKAVIKAGLSLPSHHYCAHTSVDNYNSIFHVLYDIYIYVDIYNTMLCTTYL